MKAYKKKLFKSLYMYTIGLLIIITMLFILINLYYSYSNYQKTVAHTKQTYFNEVKTNLKWEVEHFIDLINFKRINDTFEGKRKLRIRAEEAYNLSYNIYKKFRNTKSEKEIKKIIVASLRALRFENDGYYFVFDTNGTEILYANKPEFEGQNMLGIYNSENVYVVKEMISLIKKKSENFYSYKWIKPSNGNKEYKKLSFIKLFEPYNWIIGAGFYEVDLKEHIQINILKNITQMRFDYNSKNHIFIGTYAGLSLTYPTKQEKILNKQDDSGKYIVRDYIENAKKSGGFTIYKLNSENAKANKLSYTAGVPDWNWFVGAEISIDELNEKISLLKDKTYKEFLSLSSVIFGIAIVLFIFFLYMYKKINFFMVNDFDSFINFFSHLVKQDKKINPKKLKFKEFELMADYANKMLDEKILLEEDLNIYKKIVSTTGDFLAFVDKNYIFRAVNDTYVAYFQKSKEEIIGHSGADIFGEEEYANKIKPIHDRVLSGECIFQEFWIDFPIGKRYMKVNYYPYIKENSNTPEAFVISAKDSTQERLKEEKLKQWAIVFENSSEAIVLCDKNKNILEINEAFVSITGFLKDDLKNISFEDIVVNEIPMNSIEDIFNIVKNLGSWRGEIKQKRKNGEIFPSLISISSVEANKDDDMIYAILFSDISKLKYSELKSHFASYHDEVTDLPNKILLRDRINHAIDCANRDDCELGVCFIDIDKFSLLCEHYGKVCADNILIDATNRITDLLRQSDTFSRINDDDFILLLENVRNPEEIEKILNKIISCFYTKYTCIDKEILLSISIGISIYPKDGTNIDDLIYNASSCMYKARKLGKNKYVFFKEEN